MYAHDFQKSLDLSFQEESLESRSFSKRYFALLEMYLRKPRSNSRSVGCNLRQWPSQAVDFFGERIQRSFGLSF